MRKILPIVLIIFLFFTSIVHATIYYVKNGGGDGNTGLSDAQAWATITKVNSSVSGTGDDVYFKCAGTWVGPQLTVDWAGTVGNRVVIGAYYMSGTETIGVSGDKPVFDGNNLTIPTAGSYSGLVHVAQDYVTVENIRCVDSGGMGFSAKGTSTSNRILNVNFTSIESSNTYMNGVRYKYVSGGTMDSCDITRCGRGWQLGHEPYWPSCVNTNNSDDIIIKKNIVHENFGEGIGIYYGSTDCIVEDNICYANRAVQIYIDHSKNCIVRRNLCYGTTDSTYWRGAFPGDGIGINDEDRHAMLSENNKVYNNLVAYTNLGMWIATNAAASVFKDSVVYNNVLIDNHRNFEFSGGPWENSYVRNNISWCINTGSCIQVNNVPSSHPGLTFDYNLWSATPDSDAQGTHDPTYAAPLLTKTSGWRSMTAGSLAGNDFTLQDSSPAINVGVDLGSPYNLGLNPTSTWPDSVSTLDQGSYGLWEIGGFVYTGTILPVVTTQAVTDITTTTAIGHGTITDVGGESNCTKRGICWNTTGSPTPADDKVEFVGSFPAEAFSGNMTGLTPDQSYFARAYAYNTGGYGYGSTEGFNTDADASGTYIIDDGDAETSSTGTWSASGGANPYGSGSLYSHEVNATYTYEKTLDGNYTVSLWWTEYASRSSSVTVKIYDSGDNLLGTKSVNQTTLGGQWNEQDTYDFNATAKVVILSTGGGPPNVSTCADAVKFDYVEGSGGEDVNNPSCLYGINLLGCGIN